MAFDTNDRLNSDSTQQNLEEFGIWISKEPEEIADNLDTAQSPVTEEATDSFNFVEANSMPLDAEIEENLNDIPETFIEEDFTPPQVNNPAENNEEEIDLSSEFGFEDEEPFKPSDELVEKDLEKTEFDSIDFEELDDSFDSSSDVPGEFGSDFVQGIDDIQDETFTQDQIAPSPDFNLEDATIEDATPNPIKAELPPLPDFDLASPAQTDDDFEFNDKLEDIDEEVEANLDSLDRDVDHSILDIDVDDNAENSFDAFMEENAQNNDFADELANENNSSIEEIDVPLVPVNAVENVEISNIDEMPAELSALNYEETKIEPLENNLQDNTANTNFECPNSCIETEEIDLPDLAENVKEADLGNTENIEEKPSMPDVSDITMDGFADFDISAFEYNDAPAQKAGGETEVSLDDFLGGGGEDVSAQFGLSADGGFDVTDDFLAELNGEFGGRKEEKSDILDEDSVDIELEFDDQYIDNIQADASDRIEDTSNFDEFFGDDATGDASVSADNFDELFANVQDESAGAVSDFEQMFAEANGEIAAVPAKTSETVFDEVTEFDDLLFSDDGPNIEAEKAHANKINAQIDYNITVAEEDIKITQVSQKIESDNGDNENIPIFGTTIDENGAKIAMQQPIPDNGIRGPALDNSEDDSFYESLFNDAEIYDESSSPAPKKTESEADALFNELADLDVSLDLDTLQDKTETESFSAEANDFEKKTDLNPTGDTAASIDEMSFEDLMPEENADFSVEMQDESNTAQENLEENQNFDDNIEEKNINSDVFSIGDDAQPVLNEEISENTSEIAEISVEEAMEEQNHELNNEENKPALSPEMLGVAAVGLGAAAFGAEKIFSKNETENADDELLTEDDLPVFDNIEEFDNSENEEIEKIELPENFDNSENSMEQFDDFAEFPNNEATENSAETVNETVIEDSAFDDILSDTDISDINIEENTETLEEPEVNETLNTSEDAEKPADFEEVDDSVEITDLTEDSFETTLPDTALTAGIAGGVFDDVLNEEESAVEAELDEEMPEFEKLEENLEETSEINDLSFDEESENAPMELTEDSFETTMPDTPVTAGLAENAVNNNLLDNTQESKYTEPMEDEQNMNFDDISQTSEESAPSAAPANEGSVLSAFSSESVLKQISNELSMLRNEISLLKTELAKTRESVKAESVVEEVAVEPVQEPVEESVIEDDLTVNEEIVSEEAPAEEQADDTENVEDIIPEPVPEASNGFFDNDSDDETIALSDDELGNILNCADFTEEYVDNTAEVEAEQQAIPESVAALHAEVDEAYSEEVDDPVIGDVQFEEEPVEAVSDEIEVPKVDDLVAEPIEEPAVTEEEDYFADTTSDEVSSDSISDDKLAYLQEEANFEETSEPEREDISESVEEEPVTEDEIEIPAFEEEPAVASEVSNDTVEEEVADNSEIVVEEPTEEIVIDSDDEITIEGSEAPVEQPEEAAETEPVEENVDEVSDESMIEIDTDETENDELAEAGAFSEPEETPVETVFEGEQWDEPAAEAEETTETETVETVEEPADEPVVEAEPENKESIFDKASAIADKEPMNTDLKDEIKSVLVYMDQLLENLPDEKIEEFAKSSYFETYKKLFKELGLS